MNKRLPTLPIDLCEHVLDVAASEDAKPFHHVVKDRPIVGEFLGLSYEVKQPDPDAQFFLASRLPLVFHNIALTIFALTGKPAAFPRDMALPAICIDAHVPDIPSVYVDLITGDLCLEAPEGPCIQFKMQPISSSVLVYN